jgi:hypothetical protein
VESGREKGPAGIVYWSCQRERAWDELTVFVILGLLTVMAGLVSVEWVATRLLGMTATLFLFLALVFPTSLHRVMSHGLFRIRRGQFPCLPDRQYLNGCRRVALLLRVARLDNLASGAKKELAASFLVQEEEKLMREEELKGPSSPLLCKKREQVRELQLFLYRFGLVEERPGFYFSEALCAARSSKPN